MDSKVLNDKSILPNEDTIFSIIGDKSMYWKQILSYLYDNYTDISELWRYYNDGKSWLFRTLRKKDTVFWIKVLDNTFTVAFYFGDKLEPSIVNSDLPDKIKIDFLEGKRYNKVRGISIEMDDSQDFENVKILIDIKLKK